ncbi:DUF354 domain-containing protein [Algoriphagus terrigena]|uniref:DUF354 domain-containing protein n=1 Tax=Algoriphagus terrigena TaxID=344884 RepID=UPI0003FDC757|nr:DUF354 domain-containing protein [Algoriphagus terrigena]
MKYLFHLGHPAHFHLFKNTILYLKSKGLQVEILIKKKDILEDLLVNADLDFKNILPDGRKDSKFGIAIGQLKQDFKLLIHCLANRPDLLIGTSVAISHVGKLLGIPSINVNEDDAEVVPLYARLAYPWADHILSPNVCSVGKWVDKKIGYEGYHELAYLHPNHFKADPAIVDQYFSHNDNYSIVRFAKLKAHHDTGISGIDVELARVLISKLKLKGKVFVTSEIELPQDLENYRTRINPLDMHHVLAFAQIYIGDSQTMAAEAGVLGVPFIRYNDFVGRISYLEELENKYELGFGIRPGNHSELLEKTDFLLNLSDRKEIFQDRRRRMLDEKIDLADFFSKFVENYPQSVGIFRTG